MAIIESATRLFDLLASHDSTFTKYLEPGVSREEITRIIAPTGRQLTEEAVEFFSRYGLPRGYQYNPDQPHFFGIYWLLNLEDAVELITTIQAELWAEFYPEEDFPGSAAWFPLLQEDGNFYLLDVARSHEGKCPVVSMSEYGDSTTMFVSLEAMFDTLHAWVQEGALAVESGRVVGYYEGDREFVARIAVRFNPGLEFWAR